MKIKDLQLEAERMLESEEMPSLQQVLQAVGEVRQNFRDKILKSQKESEAGLEALKTK